MSKPKKIEPNHILWLVLLLAAGSLPLFASLGGRRGTPEGIEKAGPEPTAPAPPKVPPSPAAPSAAPSPAAPSASAPALAPSASAPAVSPSTSVSASGS